MAFFASQRYRRRAYRRVVVTPFVVTSNKLLQKSEVTKVTNLFGLTTTNTNGVVIVVATTVIFVTTHVTTNTFRSRS